MFDKIIFNILDVRKIRKVSLNVDDFDLYAQEAQSNFLQPLLGDKLYKALLDDLSVNTPYTAQTGRFTELVDGVVYTDGKDIIFRGVKLYLCYVWLHLYMAESALSLTSTGPKIFKDDYADHNEAKQAYRNAQAHYIQSADKLEEPIKRFLDFKSSDYPEWTESNRTETAEDVNMTFKVIGNSYTPPDNYLF